MSSLNAPLSRDRKSENFPVGSFLISPQLRKIVHLYYHFARLSDDISDDKALAPSVKKEALLGMEKALRSGQFSSEKEEIAADLGKALGEKEISFSVAGDLIKAFIQDTEKNRYENWDELMGYCANSAAPVGRFLLAIHGESQETAPFSDALCASLQVLNHLQDVKDDLEQLDRCYVPMDWMKTENVAISELQESKSSPALRRVFNRMLDKIDLLNQKAAMLPKYIRDSRLKAEAAIIVNLAHALAKTLRHKDPLEQRVSLGMRDKIISLLRGAPQLILPSVKKQQDKDGLPCSFEDMEAVEQIILKAHTSFYRGMRILPRARREAMYGIYALCRELDDIADGDSPAGSDVQKAMALLDDWSERIKALYHGKAQTALERVLLAAIRMYDLQQEDFQEIIEGMRMDLKGPIFFPDEKTLDLYCDRVASAVGRLSVRIFGAAGKNAIKVAHYLGRALQQVNILRDIRADITLGRCYLPKELADRFRLSKNLETLLYSERLPEVCQILALRAKDNFRWAEHYMRLCPAETMRPARLMAASYKATLKNLEMRGWRNWDVPLKKSLFWKLVFLLKAVCRK